MTDTWLVLDCNFLCRRASYAFQGLSHNGEPTSVSFGFFSDLIHLQRRFDAQQVVFCFDRGRNKRIQEFPEYKAKRREGHKKARLDPDQNEYFFNFRKEISKLSTSILPNIGYENTLTAYGYEADDWIAKACHEISHNFKGDEVVIVSADHDMFQCLSPTIRLYNPNAKRIYTLQSFTNDYGIPPSEWIKVKAIAGCSGDEIPGADRIGEKTAIKYLLDILPKKTKAYAEIRRFLLSKEFGRNLMLVSLPFPGTPNCGLVKHSIDPRKWSEVISGLGMDTLVNLGPYLGRRDYVS